jgi:xylulokinase
MALLMGLDVGTTGCKASVFDEAGRPIVSAYREYPLICPKPAWAELDPMVVWRHLTDTIREAAAKTDAEEIIALSISAQGEAFIPISEDGEPLYNSIVTPDQRAQDQTSSLQQTFGSQWIFQETGMVLFPIYTLNKILWIRDNLPSVFSNAARFLCWEDYVNLKLTGRAAIDCSLANRTLMFDIRNRKWSDEILSGVDLSQDLLAEIVPSGKPVGEISPSVAGDLGLSPRTLMVSGGHDQACGCLGAGVIDEGPLYDVTGTVECLMPSIKDPILTPSMFAGGFGNYCHAVPDRYLILGYNMTAGTILRWFRDEFAGEEAKRAEREGISFYSILDDLASNVPSGSDGLLLLPYFMGAATPNWDTRARGALVGLTLAHGKAHVARAIMEGITYELRSNLEALRSNSVEAGELRAVGGGARSEFWCQLKADMTQLPVRVPLVPEASTIGSALLAGIGSGVYRDFDEAVRRTLCVERSYKPREVPAYESAYRRYLHLYKQLKPLFSQSPGD